ncbi:MAG: branched-chain amino acid transport system II carrier protein [Firmicutes bacterium]|nr:branched-chain amino acid transport system II carrier protein [Bacillota bacterium]
MSNRLTPITAAAIGGSVFAMHFGGSCMLWPVTWGQQSGSSVLTAYMGIFISAIIFPWLAYLAVSKEGTLFNIAKISVNRTFAQVFGGLTVLVLGPLFAIPRMSAAAWDAICQILGLDYSPFLAMLTFTIIYYTLAFWFLYRRSQVIDKIARYLLPVLLVTIAAVVIRSLISPLAQWVPRFYPEHPFTYGFLNGYQTMDLPAALMFATLVIAGLSESHGLKGRTLNRYLILTAGIGFILLGTSHFTQMLVGASTGELFTNVSYARLYATVILELWGPVGGVIFNVALLFAALTSAVGLGGGTAAYFEEASGGRLPYVACTAVTLFLSGLVSMVGLTEIIRLTAPILDIIYPPAIVIVLFIVLAPGLKGARAGAALAAFLWGIFEGLYGYSAMLFGGGEVLLAIRNFFPGAAAGFGWVLFALIGAILGHFLIKSRHNPDSQAPLAAGE